MVGIHTLLWEVTLAVHSIVLAKFDALVMASTSLPLRPPRVCNLLILGSTLVVHLRMQVRQSAGV